MFNPFEFHTTCKLANLNLRAEKHGDENAGAADLSLELTQSNDLLAVFDPALKGMLYVKDLAQPDLLSEADADHLTRLRFPALGTLVWDKEITACDCDIAYGLGDIRLEDCARRLAESTSEVSAWMMPPAIIAFWCEFRIAPNEKVEGPGAAVCARSPRMTG